MSSNKKIIAIGKITKLKTEIKTTEDKYPLCKCLTEPMPLSFVCSGSFSGEKDYGRHHVSICLNCGRFHIFMYKNGVHFDLTFHIYSLEQAKAVMDYVEYVNIVEENNGEKLE